MTVRYEERPKLFAPVDDVPRIGRLERARQLKLPWLFLFVVVVPTVLAATYFLLIASPMYVSEAEFIVRAPSQSQPTGLTGILQNVGLAQNGDDSFAVNDYVMSRDAIAYLNHRLPLREMLARPGSDFLARFPRPLGSDSQEALYKSYKRFVSIEHSSQTGISTIKVKAFRPRDAQAIAAVLLDGGENLVNQLNARAANSAVAEADSEVAQAEARVAAAQQNLTNFRNQQGIVDPERKSTADLEMVTKLQGQLAALQAERGALAASAPQDPQLPGLDNRIRAYAGEIDAQNAKLAGEANSLAPVMGVYDQLVVQRDFADKVLVTASAADETARVEARHKRLYLERVVTPALPDEATLPNRLTSLLVAAISALLAWGTIALVLAGFREHQQA